MPVPTFTAIEFDKDDNPYDDGTGYIEKWQQLSANFTTLATYVAEVEFSVEQTSQNIMDLTATNLELASTFAASAAAKAQEAAQIVSNDAIAAIEAQFNYASVQKAIYVSNIGSWRTRGRGLSWYDPTKPSVLVGQNTPAKGQYSTVAAAVSAGGLVGEYFYNIATKFWEKITATGTPASTRIYAAGQVDFPAEVVIAAIGTGAGQRLLIHDATVAGSPLWGEFDTPSSINNNWGDTFITGGGAYPINSIAMHGSTLMFSKLRAAGPNDSVATGAFFLDFANGTATALNATAKWKWASPLVFGNQASSYKTISTTEVLPSSNVNALATCIADDAPIDPVSGEPIGYVAGASGSGAFVIKPDGTILSGGLVNNFTFVGFLENRLYGFRFVSNRTLYDFGPVDELVGGFNGTGYSIVTTPGFSANDDTMRVFTTGDELAITYSTGIDLLRPNPNEPTKSLIQKIGSNFNTGPYIDGAGTAAVMCDTTTGAIADTELAANPDFSTDTASNWLSVGNAQNIAVTGGELVWERIAGATAGCVIRSNTGGPFTGLTVGKTYKLSANYRQPLGIARVGYVAVVSTSVVGMGESATQTLSVTDQLFEVSFIALTTTVYIYFYANSTEAGDSFASSSVSLKEVTADRSGNSNNFAVVGSLARTAINSLPGAIAAYSGFSATNYLSSSNAALNVSGVAFTWPVVFKVAAGSDTALIGAGDFNVSQEERYLYVASSGVISFYTGASSAVTSAGSYADDKWHFAVLIHTATGSVSLMVDGQVVGTGSYTPAAFAESAIKVGVRINNTLPCAGSIAAFTPQTGTAWSEDQAKHWCRTMKAMIDNGNATQPAAAVAADFITRSGQTLSATSSTVYRSTNTARISSQASTVGTIATVGVGERGEIVVGGSTGLKVSVPARNLREGELRRTVKRFSIQYTGDATGERNQFPDPANPAEMAAARGATPIAVYDEREFLHLGASKDWVLKYDGFGYWTEIAVDPADGNTVEVVFETEGWE